MKSPFTTLPEPRSLSQLEAACPAIEPRPPDEPRPFWSVMIPAYNAGDYLQRTLRSVLAQDQGPSRMQIAVLDCASTQDNPLQCAREIAGDRVQLLSLDNNQGAAHSFNECVRAATGEWVHILHADDMVRPDFYAAYGDIIDRNPEVVAVGGQALQIDTSDACIGIYGPTPPPESIMHDFVWRQATRQLLLFNAIVARRSAYEKAGGFCKLLAHVCDWDMWFRLGLVGSVGWAREPHAMYRVHPGSDTNLQRSSAANIRESYEIILVNLARLAEAGLAPPRDDEWRERLAHQADLLALSRSREDASRAFLQAQWAWMLSPKRWRARVLLSAWVRQMLWSSADN